MAVSYVDTSTAFGASSAAISLAKSGSAQTGDYMLAIITRSGSHSALATVPPQFTLVGNLVASTTTTQWIYKGVVGAGDGATYDFELASTSTVWTAAIGFYRGTDPATPVDAAVQDNEASVSDTTIAVPALDTTVAEDMEVALISHSADNVTATYSAPDGTYNQRCNVQGVQTGRRNSVIYDKLLSALDPASFDITTSNAGVHVATGVALEPLVVPTEVLRPTGTRNVTALTPNTDPTAYQTIDDDPDDAGTDFLTGTDPSGPSGQTNGPEFVDAPSSATAWSGGTGATWTTYANVIDASDATNTAVTLAATNTDYQNYFSFAAGDWTDLPSDATITGFSVSVISSIGTANRVQHHIALATANGTLLSGSNELNLADNAVSATTLGASTNTAKTVTAFGTFPTRAQLVTGTFGVRFRQRRSNTSTITIYSIKATATYSQPGTTTNTKVEAIMANPVNTLLTGTDTGEIRMRVKKLGSGSNPQVKAEIHENASGTVLATPIANTTVSDTSANGVLLSGKFNQNVITTPANVEVWIIGTGAAGGLVEVGSVEWLAQYTTGGGGGPVPIKLVGMVGIRGQV